MSDPSVETLREAAEAAIGASARDDLAVSAARALIAALDAHPGDAAAAVRDALESLLGATSRNYFAQDWAAEHEFSVWARLTDDRRAWGYGSEEEIAPLRWLVELTGRWFDGHRLVTLDEWRPRFEAWAEMQHAMVRRVTPGALNPTPFPPPPSSGDARFASHD